VYEKGVGGGVMPDILDELDGLHAVLVRDGSVVSIIDLPDYGEVTIQLHNGLIARVKTTTTTTIEKT
jgi:hypothetical protein